MINKKIFLTIALLLPLTAHAAKSDVINYDVLDIGWTISNIEYDGINDENDAGTLSLSGSVSATNNLAISGSIGVTAYDDASYCENFVCDNSNQTSVLIGLIPHFPIGKNVDILIPLNLIYSDFDGNNGFSDNDTGFTVGLGIRALVNPSLELGAQLTHVDIYSNDSQSLTASARWHISGLFSLALGFSNADNNSSKTTATNISMRFSF